MTSRTYSSRRDFLTGLTSSVTAGGFATAFAMRAPDPCLAPKDPDLAVLLSDLHVNGEHASPNWQRDRLRETVTEILTLDPLPSKMLCFGDFAFTNGLAVDYAKAREILQPLEKAGIELSFAMGNHDRRENFFTFYPNYRRRCLVPDRVFSKVEFPHCDFYLFDTLVEGADPAVMNPVPGKLSKSQEDWVRQNLTNAKKPIFFGAHHPNGETHLADLLAQLDNGCGFIHGHDHQIYDQFCQTGGFDNRHIVRTVCLPSTGHWGDIGYALFRAGEKEATLTFRQREFFFPEPAPAGEPTPASWLRRCAENNGRTLTFAYADAKSQPIKPWYKRPRDVIYA